MEILKKFLISQENGTFHPKLEKIYYIFWKESCSYISGNGNPKKLLTFQELLKCFSYFQEWKFLAPNLKNFFIFQKKLPKPKN